MSCGFKKGEGWPCNFYHVGRQISVTVHSDDFTSTGRERDLRWLELEFQKKFELKTELLGSNSVKHKQEIRILNRVIAWTSESLTYEADQRHSEILIREVCVLAA